MKKILSLSLALILLLAIFSGCSKESDALVGTWAGTVNYADYFNEGLASTAGAELASYWKIEEFNLTLNMTFRDDGTYSITVDRDKLNASIEQLKQELSVGLTRYMQDLILASGTTTTVEELMNSLGISMDTLLADALSEDVINALVAECTFDGQFKVKDGKLYTSATRESGIDENFYETYEVTQNTLSLLSIVGGGETSRLDEALYPITLYRI